MIMQFLKVFKSSLNSEQFCNIQKNVIDISIECRNEGQQLHALENDKEIKSLLL